MTRVATPGVRTIDELCVFLKVSKDTTIKTLVYEGNDGLVALLVRGDHQLNEVKASKLAQVRTPLRAASEEQVRAVFGAGFGSLGPLVPTAAPAAAQTMTRALPQDVMIIADRSVAAMSDFICGANEDGYHCTGVNWGRDLPEPAHVADIRNAVAGDASPDGKGTLEICRGIEVGHVFQLGTKYSAALKATFLDAAGQARLMEMGCYGIGVSRIVAAAIEQNNDDRGIIWPQSIAPFGLAIVPIGLGKSAAVRDAAERLYSEFTAAGIDVLLDDRDERPGVMFADIELLGIPHRIVVGERGLKQGQIEYQGRRDKNAQPIALADAVAAVKSRLCAN